jgi:hypothetical protein
LIFRGSKYALFFNSDYGFPHLVERWQKTALLVFSALGRVSAKTKCAVCAAGFSACLQRLVYE